MRIGDIIKEYREKHGLSQRDMAKVLDCSYAYIAMLEKGVNPKTGKEVIPSMAYFKKMAALMGKDLTELSEIVDNSQAIEYDLKFESGLLPGLENKLIQPQGEKQVWIPVLGTIVGGNPSTAYEDRVGWEDIPISLANQGKFFALRVKGHSMEPKFLEGDTVIVKEQSTVDSGRVAVVLIDKEEATLKQVKITPEGIILIGYNTDVYEPHFYSNQEIKELPIQIVGEVIELRRRI